MGKILSEFDPVYSEVFETEIKRHIVCSLQWFKQMNKTGWNIDLFVKDLKQFMLNHGIIRIYLGLDGWEVNYRR